MQAGVPQESETEWRVAADAVEAGFRHFSNVAVERRLGCPTIVN